ncbi:MAG: beta-lactamase family protein [Chloroflexi bacterium]|nr:beta-lactamase family protein [Chloroflexota bacterium]
MRYLTPILLMLALVAPTQLQDYMDRAVEDFTGAVLVMQGGDVLLDEAYGQDAAGIPITTATVFDVGSISKQFTAAAVLHLQQRGLLSVDDSIAAHLPDVPAEKSDITIHHLLTHTAGFRASHFDDDLTPLSAEEALAAIYALPLRWEPGTHYHYSNTGYTLLALIVQTVSGEPFTQYMHTHLFEPAGMTHSGFYGEPQWAGQHVAHTMLNGRTQGSPADWPGPYWGVLGNGGVLSTTSDLLRWVQALDAGTVLAPDQVEAFWTPYVSEGEGSDFFYAYGWVTYEAEQGTVVEHNGGGIGGNSHLTMVHGPDLVVIVTSSAIVYRPPLELRFPASELAQQLVINILTEDFSRLPRPTLVLYPVLAGLLAVIGLGVGFVVWRRRRRAAESS